MDLPDSDSDLGALPHIKLHGHRLPYDGKPEPGVKRSPLEMAQVCPRAPAPTGQLDGSRRQKRPCTCFRSSLSLISSSP